MSSKHLRSYSNELGFALHTSFFGLELLCLTLNLATPESSPFCSAEVFSFSSSKWEALLRDSNNFRLRRLLCLSPIAASWKYSAAICPFPIPSSTSAASCWISHKWENRNKVKRVDNALLAQFESSYMDSQHSYIPGGHSYLAELWQLSSFKVLWLFRLHTTSHVTRMVRGDYNHQNSWILRLHREGKQ